MCDKIFVGKIRMNFLLSWALDICMIKLPFFMKKVYGQHYGVSIE